MTGKVVAGREGRTEETKKMTMKIILAAALSLGLGGAALAQTDSSGNASKNASAGDMGSMPSEWEGAIGDAFYSDTTAGTLRSHEEVSSNWSNLTAEQQARVRDRCATVTPRMPAAPT